MNILITGGSGGIGCALIQLLLEQYSDLDNFKIFATRLNSMPPIEHHKLHWHQIDCRNEKDLAKLAQQLPPLTWLINCIGLLHSTDQLPEKSISNFSLRYFQNLVTTNALVTLLLAKHFGRHFSSTRNAIFASITAKVGSIEDNKLGGWYSYRSSKAAENMALKTLSIEWARNRKNICVAALHPGTVDTALSKPFQARIPPDRLFTPLQSAEFLINILHKLEPADSGHFWSWNGEKLPW